MRPRTGSWRAAAAKHATRAASPRGETREPRVRKPGRARAHGTGGSPCTGSRTLADRRRVLYYSFRSRPSRGSGGTGRRASLRSLWALGPWGFKSPLPHHASRTRPGSPGSLAAGTPPPVRRDSGLRRRRRADTPRERQAKGPAARCDPSGGSPERSALRAGLSASLVSARATCGTGGLRKTHLPAGLSAGRRSRPRPLYRDSCAALRSSARAPARMPSSE